MDEDTKVSEEVDALGVDEGEVNEDPDPETQFDDGSDEETVEEEPMEEKPKAKAPPKAAKKAPVAKKPEPKTTKKAPVAKKPEPKATKKAPVAKKPAPDAEKKTRKLRGEKVVIKIKYHESDVLRRGKEKLFSLNTIMKKASDVSQSAYSRLNAYKFRGQLPIVELYGYQWIDVSKTPAMPEELSVVVEFIAA